MARPRATYTAEFKFRAVKMITDQKLSVAEAARRLGVNENGRPAGTGAGTSCGCSGGS